MGFVKGNSTLLWALWLSLYISLGLAATGCGLAALIWVTPTLPRTFSGSTPGAAAIFAIIYGLSVFWEVWETVRFALKPALPAQDEVENNPG